MTEVIVEGAAQLREVALRLKLAGEVELLRAMRRNIRVAVAPAKAAVKASAMATLPHGGGLNEWIASSSYRNEILTGAKTAGVRFRVTRRSQSGKKSAIKQINDGTVRHPVYGRRRGAWFDESVTPGFASRPLEELAPVVEAACLLAVHETSAAAGFH